MDKVCVIGLGYVGLPLAVAFARKMPVVGFDINQKRVDELVNGHDRTLEIENAVLAEVKSNIHYCTDIEEAQVCNIYIITVPTPIDASNKPNLTPLIQSSQTVGSVLQSGDIVIYESTVYPGVTEEVCVPELEKASGLQFNQDFHCGYSPERVNPGDKKYTVENIVKVTSGSTPAIAQKVDSLYKKIITAGTHLVSSIKVAEASKVIENTQRDVNIALVNELALIFGKMGIDTNEVLEAAGTKWNFIKLLPGLVGGHCIGVDPYYLTFKAVELGYKPNLILASRQINNDMSRHIVRETIKCMTKAGKAVESATSILILGVTFKEDCPDMRNTKVVDVIEELKEFGMQVDVYDPWVQTTEESKWYKHGIIDDPMQSDKKYDAIIVAVAHRQFKAYTMADYEKISHGAPIIMDVKNIVENPTWRL